MSPPIGQRKRESIIGGELAFIDVLIQGDLHLCFHIQLIGEMKTEPRCEKQPPSAAIPGDLTVFIRIPGCLEIVKLKSAVPVIGRDIIQFQEFIQLIAEFVSVNVFPQGDFGVQSTGYYERAGKLIHIEGEQGIDGTGTDLQIVRYAFVIDIYGINPAVRQFQPTRNGNRQVERKGMADQKKYVPDSFGLPEIFAAIILFLVLSAEQDFFIEDRLIGDNDGNAPVRQERVG